MEDQGGVSNESMSHNGSLKPKKSQIADKRNPPVVNDVHTSLPAKPKTTQGVGKYPLPLSTEAKDPHVQAIQASSQGEINPPLHPPTEGKEPDVHTLHPVLPNTQVKATHLRVIGPATQVGSKYTQQSTTKGEAPNVQPASQALDVQPASQEETGGGTSEDNETFVRGMYPGIHAVDQSATQMKQSMAHQGDGDKAEEVDATTSTTPSEKTTHTTDLASSREITENVRPTVDTFQKGLLATMGLLNKMSEEDKKKAIASMEQLLKSSVEPEAVQLLQQVTAEEDSVTVQCGSCNVNTQPDVTDIEVPSVDFQDVQMEMEVQTSEIQTEERNTELTREPLDVSTEHSQGVTEVTSSPTALPLSVPSGHPKEDNLALPSSSHRLQKSPCVPNSHSIEKQLPNSCQTVRSTSLSKSPGLPSSHHVQTSPNSPIRLPASHHVQTSPNSPIRLPASHHVQTSPNSPIISQAQEKRSPSGRQLQRSPTRNQGQMRGQLTPTRSGRIVKPTYKLMTPCSNEEMPQRGRPRKEKEKNVNLQTSPEKPKMETVTTVAEANNKESCTNNDIDEEISNHSIEAADDSSTSDPASNDLDTSGTTDDRNDWVEEQSLKTEVKLETVDHIDPPVKKKTFKYDPKVLKYLKKTGALKSKKKRHEAGSSGGDSRVATPSVESVNNDCKEEDYEPEPSEPDSNEPEAPTPTTMVEDEVMAPLDCDEPDRVCYKGYWMTREHSGTWKCMKCDKPFQFRGVGLGHLRSHTGERPFKCSICRKGFKYRTNKFRHMKDVHKVNPIMCPHCEQDFGTRKEMVNHAWLQHRIRMSGNSIFHCYECEKSFNNRSSFKSHMKYKHSSEKQAYPCDVCGKVFNFQSNLIRHKKTHTGEKPHKCEYCSAGFIERKSLMLHMMKAHDNPDVRAMLDVCQKYHCQEPGCGKEFMSKGNLLSHQRVHTKEQPFQCSYCQKRFSIKSNLKRHEATHRGERPYPCPECHKRFTEKRAMQIHYRLHTGEKPYKCEVCDKRFAQLGTLNAHKPVHSKERKHRCEECGETFLRPSHLSIHRRKHNSTPSLKCSHCEHTFYRKIDLMHHEQSHFPEPSIPTKSASSVYRCKLCQKTYHTKQDIYKHQIEEHRGEEAVKDINNPPIILEQVDDTSSGSHQYGVMQADNQAGSYQVVPAQDGYQAVTDEQGNLVYKVLMPTSNSSISDPQPAEYTIHVQMETDTNQISPTPAVKQYEELVTMQGAAPQYIPTQKDGGGENYILADVRHDADGGQQLYLVPVNNGSSNE